MKKVSLFLLLMTVASLSGLAQKGEKAVGLNLGYGSEIKNVAIGVRFNYGITDPIRLSPSFNYFFKKNGFSAWEINADVHYLFNVAPKISVYPLAGLTFISWTFDWGDSLGEWGRFVSSSVTETRFGVNIGGGIAYQLTDKFDIGLELKYGIVSLYDQFVPGIILTYKF